jgi:hypothetical protein
VFPFWDITRTNNTRGWAPLTTELATELTAGFCPLIRALRIPQSIQIGANLSAIFQQKTAISCFAQNLFMAEKMANNITSANFALTLHLDRTKKQQGKVIEKPIFRLFLPGFRNRH